jgi:opacity protein-like surface antigen
MKRAFVTIVGLITFFGIAAVAQEQRNEISVQGTGFFTKDTHDQGFSRTSTESGGVLVGYRYHFNSWFSLEANYGWNRDTQRYFTTGGASRIQSDVHQTTIDAALNLPFAIGRLTPYVLGGAGALVFKPTDNRGGSVTRASTDAQGAFLYGGGVNYPLPLFRRVALRAEYRGYVYKDPDFGIGSLHRSNWTHTAQPSAGLVYRF